MPKYPKDIKEKAIKMAKDGVHLKTIQTEIGPNLKATMRYLAAAGIDYNELRKELKEQGKEPKTLVQESRAKAEMKSDKKKASKKDKKSKEDQIVEQKETENDAAEEALTEEVDELPGDVADREPEGVPAEEPIIEE